MAKIDEFDTQTRAICSAPDGGNMMFVRHDNGLYALPGDQIAGSITTTRGEIREFEPRLTTLEKIKKWAKQNNMTCHVDNNYTVYRATREY